MLQPPQSAAALKRLPRAPFGVTHNTFITGKPRSVQRKAEMPVKTIQFDHAHMRVFKWELNVKKQRVIRVAELIIHQALNGLLSRTITLDGQANETFFNHR